MFQYKFLVAQHVVENVRKIKKNVNHDINTFFEVLSIGILAMGR